MRKSPEQKPNQFVFLVSALDRHYLRVDIFSHEKEGGEKEPTLLLVAETLRAVT